MRRFYGIRLCSGFSADLVYYETFLTLPVLTIWVDHSETERRKFAESLVRAIIAIDRLYIPYTYP